MCYRMCLAASSTIAGADGEPRQFDYTRRTGIAATGGAAPSGTDRSWRDPVTWARRIEAVDKRRNSRQCRDDVVGTPVELVEAGAAKEAVQAYADRLAAEHKAVVHFALHKPDRGGRMRGSSACGVLAAIASVNAIPMVNSLTLSEPDARAHAEPVPDGRPLVDEDHG